ncbi:MAG: type IV secretion system DotC family protein [Alphaproteobacteria bacterium]
MVTLVSFGLTACIGPNEFGQQDSKVNLEKVEYKSDTQPPPLDELQDLRATTAVEGDIAEFKAAIIKDVALSLGARGGLAHRSWEINEKLDGHTVELTRIYAFDRLSIKAPSGSIVMPPIVIESSKPYSVAEDGQAASAADRVYRIIKPGEIVGRPPNWRDYLVRTWDFPEPPHPSLLPKTDAERELWREWVDTGWKEGVQQAEEIFEDDLERLQRDIEGMARYRALVAQGLVTEMYFDRKDRGVTGDANELRIGDRVVNITAPAQFDLNSQSWSPVLIDAPQGYKDPMSIQ